MRDSGRMLHMAHEAMIKAGVDVPAVFQRLGMRPLQGGVADVRTPHEAQVLFWQVLEEVTGDPDIGVHLARHLPVYGGDVIDYLFLSSPNVREGIRRATNYLRLVSDALHAQITEAPDGACATVTATVGDSPYLRHTEVCVVRALIQFFSKIVESGMGVRRVELRMAKPARSKDYGDLFGCPVVFGAPLTRIHFDPALLERASPYAEADLLKLHEQLAQKKLSTLARQDLIDNMRRVFAQGLEYEVCDLNTMAQKLGLAPRRLRFELTRAGSSFNQVLSEFRYDLARYLLAHSEEPVERVAYLTGFSELSTFYRAFRRWAGRTPVQYREEKKRKGKPTVPLPNPAFALKTWRRIPVAKA